MVTYKGKKFTKLYGCQDGLITVKARGKFGYIDIDGNYVINPIFDFANDFNDERALVKYKGAYGFIDTSGAFIIPTIYDWCQPQFCDGVAVVQINEMYGCIDRNGVLFVPLLYDFCIMDYLHKQIQLERNHYYTNYIDLNGFILKKQQVR